MEWIIACFAAAVALGALVGGLCYATFDPTSEAVMKVGSTHLSLIDIAWRAIATAIAASVATWAALRFAA